jgi:hypothetical protein
MPISLRRFASRHCIDSLQFHEAAAELFAARSHALDDAGVNQTGGMIGESAVRDHRRNKVTFPLLREAAKGRES